MLVRLSILLRELFGNSILILFNNDKVITLLSIPWENLTFNFVIQSMIFYFYLVYGVIELVKFLYKLTIN